MPRQHISLSSYVEPLTPPIIVLPTLQNATSYHSHDFYEIVYIQQGFCMHDCEGVSTLLMAGDLFAIRPGEEHRYIGNGDVKLYNCLFLTEGLGSDLEQLMKLPGMEEFLDTKTSQMPWWRTQLDLKERRLMHNQLKEMVAERENALPGWEIRLKCQLICFLVDFCRILHMRFKTDTDKKPYLGYVAQALTYIDNGYFSDISIKEIATHVGVSSDYLTRQFRQVTGIAPVEYLRRLRFAKAMELLQQKMSISEVSTAVGFNNLCHFSREFKLQLGMTPSQFRKSMSGEMTREDSLYIEHALK